MVEAQQGVDTAVTVGLSRFCPVSGLSSPLIIAYIYYICIAYA